MLRHLSLATKCRLYSSCILAVLLYACETWTLTKSDWKRLESFHLRCQRRILGIKWSDFTMNAKVYTRSGLQSIQSIVRQRRLSLFGHVARMPDNVPAKAVLRVACNVRDGVPPFPNWRRSRGRPSITWLHQICSDCDLSAGDALNCAQDRAAWRTYATASSALRWRRRPCIHIRFLASGNSVAWVFSSRPTNSLKLSAFVNLREMSSWQEKVPGRRSEARTSEDKDILKCR